MDRNNNGVNVSESADSDRAFHAKEFHSTNSVVIDQLQELGIVQKDFNNDETFDMIFKGNERKAFDYYLEKCWTLYMIEQDDDPAYDWKDFKNDMDWGWFWNKLRSIVDKAHGRAINFYGDRATRPANEGNNGNNGNSKVYDRKTGEVVNEGR